MVILRLILNEIRLTEFFKREQIAIRAFSRAVRPGGGRFTQYEENNNGFEIDVRKQKNTVAGVMGK